MGSARTRYCTFDDPPLVALNRVGLLDALPDPGSCRGRVGGASGYASGGLMVLPLWSRSWTHRPGGGNTRVRPNGPVKAFATWVPMGWASLWSSVSTWEKR